MSTRGFSLSVPMSGPGGVPLGGDVDFYLDVTSGDNAHHGTAWNDAFLTWQRAMDAVEEQIATNPDLLDITIHVTNSTGAAIAAGSFAISSALPGRTRLHVVCDFDRWVSLAGPGTVGMGGITAEPGSGLASVAIGAGFVPAATDVGKTLRLTRPVGDPNVAEILPLTILGLGTIANSYIVSTRHADIPAFWDADALTICSVIEAPNVLNGELTFAPISSPVVDTAIFGPKNWLVGVRANNIIISGEETAMAMCECRTVGAPAAPDGYLIAESPGGAVCGWTHELTIGLITSMTLAHARSWGLMGAVGFVNQCLGNGSLSLVSRSGPNTRYSGYVVNDATIDHNGYMLAERFRARSLIGLSGAQVVSRYFRVIGTGQAPCINAANDGTDVSVLGFCLEDLANGPASIVTAENDARVQVAGTDVCVLSVVPANFPVDGFICDGARLEFTAGITDALSQTINGRLIYVDNMGEVECVGAINMVTARPGVGAVSDILIVNNSKMVVRGNILKTAPNTIPSRCLDVDWGSRLDQASGNFTHGAAPANWTNSYTAGGLVWADHGSFVHLGIITDGGVGAGAGVATSVLHGSQFWYAANGGLTGAAICQVGIAAAAAFPAAAVLNDLPAAPAGVEHLAVMGVA